MADEFQAGFQFVRLESPEKFHLLGAFAFLAHEIN
jgi:hypothetical protein